MIKNKRFINHSLLSVTSPIIASPCQNFDNPNSNTVKPTGLFIPLCVKGTHINSYISVKQKKI